MSFYFLMLKFSPYFFDNPTLYIYCFILSLGIIPGTYAIKLIPIVSVIMLVLIGQLLVKLPWANNPLISVVSDVCESSGLINGGKKPTQTT